jgi:hypothetical protein
MTRPKLRVRTLIFVIAIIAVILAITAHESRRQRLRTLRELAAKYSEREAYWIDQEKAMMRNEGVELAAGRQSSAAVIASQTLYDRDQARYYGLLRLKYEEALHHPDMPMEPDPLAPSLYPRDYLSKVPYYVPDHGPGERPLQ